MPPVVSKAPSHGPTGVHQMTDMEVSASPPGQGPYITQRGAGTQEELLGMC